MKFTVSIKRDGVWPTVWSWSVNGRGEDWPREGAYFGYRYGQSFTKDRARRKAVEAKRSMERDDVTVFDG